MPVVRDVGARFIAPDCRHTVRWAMYMNCCRERWPPGLSRHPPRTWLGQQSSQFCHSFDRKYSPV